MWNSAGGAPAAFSGQNVNARWTEYVKGSCELSSIKLPIVTWHFQKENIKKNEIQHQIKYFPHSKRGKSLKNYYNKKK